MPNRSPISLPFMDVCLWIAIGFSQCKWRDCWLLFSEYFPIWWLDWYYISIWSLLKAWAWKCCKWRNTTAGPLWSCTLLFLGPWADYQALSWESLLFSWPCLPSLSRLLLVFTRSILFVWSFFGFLSDLQDYLVLSLCLSLVWSFWDTPWRISWKC